MPASPPRPFQIPPWLLAAACGLLVFAAYTAWQDLRAGRDLAALKSRADLEQQRSQALGSEQQQYLPALRIVAAPDTQALALASKNSTWPPITVYWNLKMGMVVAAEKLPAIPANRTLQFWILPREGRPLGITTFRPDENGRVFLAVQPNDAMRTAEALIVNEEPSGGSPQPTSPSEWIHLIR
jgi:hypothetical protein